MMQNSESRKLQEERRHLPANGNDLTGNDVKLDYLSREALKFSQENAYWKNRALSAEAQLAQEREALGLD